MARVPVVNRRVEDTATLQAVKTNVQAPTSDANSRNLSRIGQAVTQTAGHMDQVLTKLKRDKDEASAREAYVAQSEKATAYREAAFAQTGKNTDGAVARAKDDYRNMTANTISQFELTGDAAVAFKRQADRLYLSDQRVIARHQSNELRKWSAQTVRANLKAESNTLMSQAQALTIDEYTRYVEERINPIIDEAAQFDPKSAAEIKATSAGLLYANAIDQSLATGQTDRAREQLNTWDKSLSGRDRVRLTAGLRSKELQIDSGAIAAEYMAEGRSKKETMEFMKDDINDDDLRTMTAQKYRALFADKERAEQTKYVDTTYEYQNQLERIIQDQGLAAGQNFVRSLPKDSQVDRKIFNHVESLYARHASGKGVDRLSDANQYLFIGDEIEEGRINTVKELQVAAKGKLTASDLAEMESKLKKAQKVSDKELKQNLATALGSENFKALSKGQQTDVWYAFSVWSRSKIQESNKASDPAYIQELASRFVMTGEDTTKVGFGQGADRKFYEAIKDPNFIVDVVDDTEATSGISLTKTKVKEVIRSLINSGTWTSILAEADGDEEVAARMAWSQMLRERFNPDKVSKLMIRNRPALPPRQLERSTNPVVAQSNVRINDPNRGGE